MEKIIYVLLPIAYFLYQAYNNYLKEQEKAKKRNLAKPLVKTIIPEKVAAKEEKFDVKEFLREKFSLETERKEIIKSQTKTIPEYQIKDYYNPEVAAAEVVQNRKIHSVHPHKVDLVVSHEEVETGYVFDLRTAVIQQAILNRPYKD